MSTTDRVVLDGTTLTCAQVSAIASGRPVALGSTAAAERSWRTATALSGPVYGRTTGVGANKDVTVHDRGRDLLRSHAAAAGPLIGPERATAMMAVRLNQLLRGGSGLDPALLPVLAEAINRRAIPPIREYGAIGTGDLSALSTTALCLLGEISWNGPAFPLASADALPFISSGALTLADAALAIHDLRRLLEASIRVTAKTWQAVRASTEPLAAAVQHTAVAATLRELLPAIEPARIQDPYGYRAYPQVHQAAFTALQNAEISVTEAINSALENPLITTEAHHNGNFHTGPIALTLDTLRAALAQTASLSAARLATLMEPSYTGRLPFLAATEGASGLIILEYVAHDALATLRHLATPVTTGTAVLSRGVEDHAGFATQAARMCGATREPYEIVLACELLSAERALNGPEPDRPIDIEAARRRLDGSH
ncbi:histidine ammonia-lyase [Acrocarpospora corrugata]|uniref:Histidine ammonia-lyase n=1 Tax=Acrocarpospora corrugata TaxID=35763 RepID=A0A5M3W4N0_9ACTN|nr:aromatic amino acid lyase [Acrocarpospora corrugata]GES03696.1 histidine ammonia-lyase [Acrocarpospora corrugata]